MHIQQFIHIYCGYSFYGLAPVTEQKTSIVLKLYFSPAVVVLILDSETVVVGRRLTFICTVEESDLIIPNALLHIYSTKGNITEIMEWGNGNAAYVINETNLTLNGSDAYCSVMDTLGEIHWSNSARIMVIGML